MSQYLVDQIHGTPSIEVRLRHEVTAVHGQQHLEAITIADRAAGTEETVPAAALFLFIGATAHTELLTDLVERDRAGFILTGQDLMHDGHRPKGWTLKRDPFPLETSVPGIFAAGDVRHGSIKRVASAVGEGAVAVALVHQYLKTV
jgi:thioredoxin reductase (NADPH)